MKNELTLTDCRRDVMQIIGDVIALTMSESQREAFTTRPADCAITDEIIDQACALRRKIKQADRKPHTVKNWISELRGQFRDMLTVQNKCRTNPLPPDMLKRVVMTFNGALVVPDDAAASIEARATARREARALQVITIDRDMCQTIFARLRLLMAEELIAPEALCAYAGIMTGRRPIEWRVKNFELRPGVLDDPQPWRLNFSGQAKTRRGELPPVYAIPVLDDPQRVIDCMVSIDIMEMRRFGRTQYDWVARQIGWPLDKIEMMPNTMRAFYACWCSHELRSSAEQDWRYIGRIFGHTPHDIVTCQAYKRFAIQ